MAEPRIFDNWIDGGWTAPAEGGRLDAVDPTSGAVWARIPDSTAVDVDRAVAAARRAFTEGPWASMRAAERGKLLWRLGDRIVERADDLAALETRDNGKRTADILPGLQTWLADSFHYYAGLADKVAGEVLPVDVPGIFNYTRREPFGVVGCITAWNSPLLIAIWKIAPALAAGNTVVVKPSEHASVSTLALAEIVADLLPPGVVNVVTGLGERCGAPLVDHEDVRLVSFTGSVDGGRVVAAVAARTVTPTIMELGGKSPQVVFADADLTDAAHGVAMGLFPPAGQSCVAGSRLLVDRSVQDDLVERIATVAGRARLGPPDDPATQIGPLANRPHFDRVRRAIERARLDGARLILGGGTVTPEGTCGWFVEPTIFVDVDPASELFREEIFGPVLAVVPFDDEDEAIRLANDTSYGLAAGIWTTDQLKAMRVAEAIEAGTVYLNNYFNSATQSPVGGYKQSGHGRENGVAGLEAFLQTKSVWMNTVPGIADPFPTGRDLAGHDRPVEGS